MRDHSGQIPGFYILSESYYGDASIKGHQAVEPDFVDELMIGFYDENDGGTSGEFAIRFSTMGKRIVPRLEAYHDSWSSMWRSIELIRELSLLDNEENFDNPPSRNQIIEVLKKLGFKDLTKREWPKREYAGE